MFCDSVIQLITSDTYVNSFFSFSGSAPSEIYTLSLHDALPIFNRSLAYVLVAGVAIVAGASLARPLERAALGFLAVAVVVALDRKEHTSELQSRRDLVCRLLLEKKN